MLSRLFVAGLSVVTGAAFAVPAAAQQIPNLSGHWVLDMAKSDFGPAPGGPRSDVIDHQEPNLVITRSLQGPNGQVEANLTYVVDGKPHTNTIATTEATSSLKWDGPVLVMTSVVQTPQGAADITDRFTLAADGKTLTIARSIDFQGQSVDQTMVFTKQ